MGPNIAERIRLLVSEVLSRHRLVAIVFLLISLAATGAGLIWPKTFTSSATVHVSENRLMEGIVPGSGGVGQEEWGELAQETLFGRSVLTKVAARGGWNLDAIGEEDAEYLFDRLRSSTEVGHVGDSLIRIEYSDSKAGRAQRVAQAFADLLIDEILQGSAASSEKTLGFIEQQAKKYEQKLQRLESAVEAFRTKHDPAGPEAQEQAAERTARLAQEYRELKRQLQEARFRARKGFFFRPMTGIICTKR